jgi:electron transport complex protein RnfB
LIKTIGLGVKGTQAWCEIDFDRCVGCELCIRIPQKNDIPIQLTVCPWDAIEMVPTEQLPLMVAHIGGPSEYIRANLQRLMGTARQLARHRYRNPV